MPKERSDRYEIKRALRGLSFQDMILLVLIGIYDMSQELDRLTQEVADTKTSVDSVLTLVEGLAQQIRDNATDPAALKALADELDSQQGRIAAAVAANTPAPPVEPDPEQPAEPNNPPVEEPTGEPPVEE